MEAFAVCVSSIEKMISVFSLTIICIRTRIVDRVVSKSQSLSIISTISSGVKTSLTRVTLPTEGVLSTPGVDNSQVCILPTLSVGKFPDIAIWLLQTDCV